MQAAMPYCELLANADAFPHDGHNDVPRQLVIP